MREIGKNDNVIIAVVGTKRQVYFGYTNIKRNKYTELERL